MTIRAQRWINRGATLLGVLLAAGFVAAGSVPAGERPLRAAATIDVSATGGLAVAPQGRVLRTRSLAPGGPAASARLVLLNQTSAAASVLVRAGGPAGDLDQQLRLQLRIGNARPLNTSLGQLRRWRALAGPLASQRRARVLVRARIPAGVDRGWEARRASVALEFVRRGTQR